MAISSPATFADRLNDELTRLAIAQFETPEFRLLFDTRLTLAGARFVAIQMTFYNVNRRDCWAYTQAKAPRSVKLTIWEHEKDELYFDPRGGADHRALMSKQALALGIWAEQLPLGSLTLSHFLERRNNSELIPGGGFSKRMRDKLVNEVGIASDALVSSNVHVAADVDHSDSIWSVIAEGVTDEASYGVALEGARTTSVLDRAFRAALAYGMR